MLLPSGGSPCYNRHFDSMQAALGNSNSTGDRSSTDHGEFRCILNKQLDKSTIWLINIAMENPL